MAHKAIIGDNFSPIVGSKIIGPRGKRASGLFLSGQTNVNMKTYLDSKGIVDGDVTVYVTGDVSSDDKDTPALLIPNTLDVGLNLTLVMLRSGRISGAGGVPDYLLDTEINNSGLTGNLLNDSNDTDSGFDYTLLAYQGGDGGPALTVQRAVTIEREAGSFIWGGGGAGGGMGWASTGGGAYEMSVSGGGGQGGGNPQTYYYFPSAIVAPVMGWIDSEGAYWTGGLGEIPLPSAGTLSAPGSGGGLYFGSYKNSASAFFDTLARAKTSGITDMPLGALSGDGGSAGQPGNDCSASSLWDTPATTWLSILGTYGEFSVDFTSKGGAAGAAIVGNSNITWTGGYSATGVEGSVS